MSDTLLALQEQYEALLKEKEMREAAKRESDLAASIQLLQLEAKYELELGPRGVAFEIIDCATIREPHIVVKRGSGIEHKRFAEMAVKATKENVEIPDSVVEAYIAKTVVHPEPEKFKALMEEWPTLGIEVANTVATLFSVQPKKS